MSLKERFDNRSRRTSVLIAGVTIIFAEVFYVLAVIHLTGGAS